MVKEVKIGKAKGKIGDNKQITKYLPTYLCGQVHIQIPLTGYVVSFNAVPLIAVASWSI